MSMAAVAQLWRYPIKSMAGESLPYACITASTGVLGDRAYALLDVETGRIASAKHPRNWGRMLGFTARVFERDGDRHPRVVIEFPDGRRAFSDQPDIDRVLSEAVAREVRLVSVPPRQATFDEYEPERDAGRAEPLAIGAPEGTFFDFAALHLVTTATLGRLRELRPESLVEVARFRPNIVVDTGPGSGFHENDWVGRELAIGDEVRAYVAFPCPRCVMTTLPQGRLPSDPEILRAAAENQQLFVLLAKRLPTVGVYARVVRGGTIRAGDSVRIENSSPLRRIGTYASALRRVVSRR
jgi:MOSC domain-containing protein